MYTTPSGEDLPRRKSKPAGPPKTRAAGTPYRNVPDKGAISMFGVGILVGVAIGAGVALLAAPLRGEDVRDNIRDRFRHLRGRDRPWDKLARELRRASAVRRRHDLERHRKQEQKLVDRQRAERDARIPPE
ncbi:MAG: YtxH domain-containing protein [Gemmatimonadota bacterium]|nr:YtxH domain-containing protein [Gemmatimonadota bacterium]